MINPMGFNLILDRVQLGKILGIQIPPMSSPEQAPAQADTPAETKAAEEKAPEKTEE